MGKNILQTTNKRVRPLWLCPLIKKIFTLFIWLLLLPVTALAADMNTVYVGGVALTGSSENIVYATTNGDGEVITNGADADKYNIKWDGSTLTLDGAKIKGGTSSESLYATVGIYAFSNSGDVSLNIALKGVNEIFESSDGIWVYSSSYNAGAVTLTIEGEGSLNASGSSSGILVQSNNGNATLTIQNAEVTATSTVGVGVQVRSGAQKSASLTVDGGSLTATGMSEYGAGIRYTFGSSSFGSGKPSLTVSGNTIVRANGGIANNSSTSIQYGTGNEENGGIVFDGNEGTVYGSVTLQENLEIGEGESLTIPEDSSLDMGGHTITVENGGKLEGSPIGNGTVKIAPTITTTESLPDGEVGTVYSQTLTATGDPTITWNVTSGTLPAGLTLDTNTGTISGTPTTANTYSFTVTATNASGSDSKEYTIQIAAKSDTTPPTLTAGTVNRSSDKDATVTFNSNEAGTYFYNVVDSGASEPTDITSGTSYNLNSDTNTITLTDLTAGAKDIYIVAKDAAGNQSATLKIEIPTYVEPVYSISADTELDFGSVYTGYAQPAAQTVTITNNGNQPLTLTQPASTSSFVVGTLSTASLPVNGTATFTVQPKAGLAVGTYSENITVSSSEGATVTIPTSFNVRKEVKVEPSGSTNLSFTTDRDEFSLTATVHAQGNDLNPKDGSWTWAVADEDVVALSGSPTLLRAFVSSSRQAFTVEGTGTTTITATYDDGTYRGLVEFKVSISKPTPPDPISYYNIYVEDVCDGVEVSTSKQVVREGGSVSVYVKKDTVNYTFDNFKVYYKRSYYGGWEELKEGTQPGEYPIKNIWTHIYIKAEGAEEKEDPTGIEQIEGVKVYTKDGSLYVQTPQREQVIIVSMSGAVVKNEEQIGLKQYHGLQPGIYIVRIGDRAYKLRLN